MECPKCNKQVGDFHRVWSDKPFTAKEALPGLAAWGGLDVERTVLCESGQFVHFKFDHSGDERLVEMCPDMPERREIIMDHYESMKHKCDKEGCEKDGWPGWSLWGEEEPICWSCDEHAHEQGFCFLCHYFYAGLYEDFDFGPGPCPDCRDQVNEDDGYEDWEDEDDYCGESY